MTLSCMDLLAALALQIEWGADEALVEVAPDRLRQAAVRPGIPTVRVHAVGTAAVTDAPAAEAPAPDLAALLDSYAAFTGCALRDTATSFVRPSGDPASGIVWLTGPPGEDDDRTGLPASGPDGALLDQVLASIGLTRQALLLVPFLPWRPPGGRTPNAAECTLCLPFLRRLLALVRPRTLILEAGLPAQTFLPRGAGRARAVAMSLATIDLAGGGERPPQPVAAVGMPSLSSVRQSPERRREAWQRLRLLRRHLDAELPKK